MKHLWTMSNLLNFQASVIFQTLHFPSKVSEFSKSPQYLIFPEPYKIAKLLRSQKFHNSSYIHRTWSWAAQLPYLLVWRGTTPLIKLNELKDDIFCLSSLFNRPGKAGTVIQTATDIHRAETSFRWGLKEQINKQINEQT